MGIKAQDLVVEKLYKVRLNGDWVIAWCRKHQPLVKNGTTTPRIISDNDEMHYERKDTPPQLMFELVGTGAPGSRLFWVETKSIQLREVSEETEMKIARLLDGLVAPEQELTERLGRA
jgi:hypothetical protein